ncbi:MAG: hypothetical protein WA888_14380 [Burkholderiaceae bacterium]
MQFNTWGIGRRDELARDFDADDYPFIERVRQHLGLNLVEIRGNGEPVQIALGESPNTQDPEAVQARVTPFFSSFDALDFFCRINLQQYLAFDPSNGLPRHWFWDDSRGSRGQAMPARAKTIAGRPLTIAAGIHADK